MQIVLIIFSFLVAIFSGYLIVLFKPDNIFYIILSLFIFIFSFFSTKLSLILLIFSMLLSPEIKIAELSRDRSIVIRYDDIILLIIFFSWFFKNAIFKTKPFITRTTLQLPLLIYTSVFIFSTFLGIIRGDVTFYKSFFYVFKYIEYFLLYFMCVNIIEPDDIQKYFKYWSIVFIIVTLYAYYYYFSATGMDIRATAPFEAPLNDPQQAEPASLGGFYIIAFSILLSIISGFEGKNFFYSLSLIIFAFPAFLYTFSRASYAAIFVVFLLYFIFARKKRLFLLSLIVAFGFGMLMSPYAYKKVENRIKSTFSGEYAIYNINFLGMNIKLEESAYLRYYTLKKVLTQHLPKNPLFGKGVTGIGLGDSQYALLLGEIGIIGFFAFWFWVIKIYKIAYKVYKNSEDKLFKSIGLAVILSLSGLLVQAWGVNTFIIVRIMEPFWFSIAILTSIYLKQMSIEEKNLQTTSN